MKIFRVAKILCLYWNIFVTSTIITERTKNYITIGSRVVDCHRGKTLERISYAWLRMLNVLPGFYKLNYKLRRTAFLSFSCVTHSVRI